MGKLDGKVAIVTGGARGLGRAYARRLAGLGQRCAMDQPIRHGRQRRVADRHAAPLAALAEHMRSGIGHVDPAAAAVLAGSVELLLQGGAVGADKIPTFAVRIRR